MVNVKDDKSTNFSDRIPRDNNDPKHDVNGELFTAIIILGVTVFLLILIILCGYCNYLKKKKKPEGEVEVIVPNTRKSSPGANSSQSKEIPEQILAEEKISVRPPPKSRKRSMTFTETDEDCRKYREDLISSYDSLEAPPPVQTPYRKKSVVTFAGLEQVSE